MKGLAFDVIASLLIAAAGAAIFISLITGTFHKAANWVYCNVFINIATFFRSGHTIPEICKVTHERMEGVQIVESGNTIFSRRLLAYIIACWEKTEMRGLYKSHSCYEIETSRSVETVDESDVTDILIKEDHCQSIDNSDYGCGTRDQIVWSVDGEASLTETDIADAINMFTLPNPIPIDDSMIPDVSSLNRKIQLKAILVEDVPELIETSVDGFEFWEYNSSTAVVSFSISSIIYNYSIDEITSYLEKAELINSPINYQSVILIEYNGPKDAIEVIG